ncbi:hypothetical protein CXB51_010384 [Gossypium anomalum]|uniref:Reverse transcriptase Ty1/copia-type domain-containing protein n=1 Tax=Gossypium anomalum TaxID=47600 RepID=A0A8J5ZD33_9ROSI|nr:hypothetical protein CXB51_010384 [Gossypium anomalum]
MAANNTLSLRSILEKDKLNDLNFLDWLRNLRIVLKQEQKLYVIEQPPLNEPSSNALRVDRDAHKKHFDDKKQHEDMVAYDMIEHLKELYQGQARQERFDISKALFQCKLAEGSPVGPHVLKMIGYIGSLSKLGFPLSQELATDVILQSLSDIYNQFVLNFNINEIDKNLPQLLSMLPTAEGNMKKVGPKPILMVRNNKGKGKAKNYPIYLEEIKKAKTSGTSASGIYVIDINLSTTTSWVLDTGCGSHICTSVQRLQRSRTLARGDMDLRVGNGARVVALVAGTYILSLPSGFDLCLEDCGEYLSLEFDNLLKECGIVTQLTPPEREFISRKESGRKIELEEIRELQDTTEPEIEQQHIPQEIEEQVIAVETQLLRRSLRERHAPERYGFLITTHGDILLLDQDEPRTYQEAVMSPDSEKWLEAMRSEMDSMYENQAWTLIDPPEGVKPIGCKWVFKKKTDMDGNMDVKIAFLNGKLEEDVYMTQPEGFFNPKNAKKICKLQRSIYGLKQASRSWNLRFNDAIKEFGFIKNEYEPCVYKKVSGSTITFLVLYVDDILIMGNDIPTLQSTKTWLGSCFSMKDLGEATYILGVKIYRDRSRRLLGEEELSVKGYTDASFQVDKDDSRSQPGFVFCLNGGAVSWKSSKQSTVADSTTEAEYIAASEATKEGAWIKKFITELGVVPSISDAIEL